jgi:hypothetical protein
VARKFASLYGRRGIILGGLSIIAAVAGLFHPGFGFWEGPG